MLTITSGIDLVYVLQMFDLILCGTNLTLGEQANSYAHNGARVGVGDDSPQLGFRSFNAQQNYFALSRKPFTHSASRHKFAQFLNTLNMS